MCVCVCVREREREKTELYSYTSTTLYNILFTSSHHTASLSRHEEDIQPRGLRRVVQQTELPRCHGDMCRKYIIGPMIGHLFSRVSFERPAAGWRGAHVFVCLFNS